MARVLLVEDDGQLRLLIEEMLRDAGYDVDSTGTAAGGRSLLNRRDYDLLLTDGRLPDGNGLMVAQIAIQLGVPVLIVTGYAHEFPRDQREYFTVLQKPVRMSVLLHHVAQSVRT